MFSVLLLILGIGSSCAAANSGKNAYDVLTGTWVAAITIENELWFEGSIVVQAENPDENGEYQGGALNILAQYSESAAPEDVVEDEWDDDEPVVFEVGLRVVPETTHPACKVFLLNAVQVQGLMAQTEEVHDHAGHYIATPKGHQTSRALKDFFFWSAAIDHGDLLSALPVLGLSKNAALVGPSFFELAVSRPASQTHAVLSIHTTKLVVIEMRKKNSDPGDSSGGADAEIYFVGTETARKATSSEDVPRSFWDRIPQTIVHGYLMLRVSNFYKAP